MVRDVAREQLVVRPRRPERVRAGRLGVPSPEARGRGQAQGHGLGVHDPQLLPVHVDAAAERLGREPDREREPVSVPAGVQVLRQLQVVLGIREVAAPAAAHEEPARRKRTRHERVLAVHGGREAQPRGAVGGQAHDEDLIGRAREDLAGEAWSRRCGSGRGRRRGRGRARGDSPWRARVRAGRAEGRRGAGRPEGAGAVP